MNKNLPVTELASIASDDYAEQAESLFQKISTVSQGQISDALEVGRLMTEAKKAVPHGCWIPTLQRWHTDRIITFSDRSLRRWMRMAKYSNEIKLATLANLAEAETFAQNEDRKTAQRNNVSKKRQANQATMMANIEKLIINKLRSLANDKQRGFLADLSKLVQRLTNRFDS